MTEQKRNKLTENQKKEIIEKTKIARDEHPEIPLLDLCTSMIYHFVQKGGPGFFATTEAIILCTKSFYDIEGTPENQVRKSMN